MDMVDYKVRIPEIDKLLKKHNSEHVNIVHNNNSEVEKKQLKELDIKLSEDIDYVNCIIEEVLEYLKARGCKVSEYI
tara:strand:- start:1564 stop:1794 length:231 start_codon:yes stop_codon:yes gene_type:complete